MRLLEIAASVRRDLDSAFAHSETVFGAAAARRYRRLVETALRQLRLEPDRAGVVSDPELPSGVRLYHLRHSRRRRAASSSVGRPRHLIVFRRVGDGLLIVRVLHDAMDLPAHLGGQQTDTGGF